jgi:NAD(P)-dependent dehydrogenase (short-subunit alcohol dehydrogenase family)
MHPGKSNVVEPVAPWPLPDMPGDLGGRMCLITGASGGIGLATARGLGRLGARVVLVCRDGVRGALAQQAVTSSGRLGAELLIADLRSQRSVRHLAHCYLERFDPPRILIHNAGIVTPTRLLTEEGIETQFAVNHLAPFLLTNLLLDSMKRTAPARIVVVASQVERGGVINFDDLMGERHYDPLRAYSQSKLANVMFTYSQAELLEGSGVTVNCLHPGIVRSALLETIGRIEEGRGAPKAAPLRALAVAGRTARRMAQRALRRKPVPDWALTPEEGARTTLYVAASTALENVSGRFFREAREAPSSPMSMDRDARQRLWAESELLTGLR